MSKGSDSCEELNEACGILAVVAAEQNSPDVSPQFDFPSTVLLGIVSVQHRGQESAGVVGTDGNPSSPFVHERGKGLVSEVLAKQAVLEKLAGARLAIGHTRYSTKGAKSSALNAVQPYVVYTVRGQVALAHNGELVNALAVRKSILPQAGLSTDTDSELIAQLLAMKCPRISGSKKKRPGSATSSRRGVVESANGHMENRNGSGNEPHVTRKEAGSATMDSGTDDDDDGETSDWPAAIRYMMSRLTLSYSLVILTASCVYVVRDPYGNRPLVLGEIPGSEPEQGESVRSGETTSVSNGGVNGNANGVHGEESRSPPRAAGWIACSESCAFHSTGAQLVRDVRPGEIVEISPRGGIRSLGFGIDASANPHPALSFCIFEYVYFARPDSVMETVLLPDGTTAPGQQVYSVRYRCGRVLGMEAPISNPDSASCVVSTIPDSATPAALGYASATHLPYRDVLQKCRYGGAARTFIAPTDADRKSGVARKFTPLSHNFVGKRVIIIDDSIVRGNTMGPVVALLRRAGAAEVHIRVACPPVRHPCYMGINIPTRGELIANKLSFPAEIEPGTNLDEFARVLKADSVAYLSLDGLKSAVSGQLEASRPSCAIGYCTACFDGKYPVDLEGHTESDVDADVRCGMKKVAIRTGKNKLAW